MHAARRDMRDLNADRITGATYADLTSSLIWHVLQDEGCISTVVL